MERYLQILVLQILAASPLASFEFSKDMERVIMTDIQKEESIHVFLDHFILEPCACFCRSCLDLLSNQNSNMVLFVNEIHYWLLHALIEGAKMRIEDNCFNKILLCLLMAFSLLFY